MSDDWSVNGDIGLGSVADLNDRNPIFRTRGESYSSCKKTDKPPRRALIRTLSGSWIRTSEKSQVIRRSSYDGGVDLGQFPELHRKPSLTKRNSSLTCCPETIRKLRRKIGIHLEQEVMGESEKSQEMKDSEALLQEANKTMTALQAKLDVYEGLLYGKSKASEVLLHQLSETVRDRAHSEAHWRSESREQRIEAGRLQFQLLSVEENVTDNQRAWLDRINSVVKENSELHATVQTQTRLIRKLSLDRTAWKKEYDELCSLQDARERTAYQNSDTQMSERGKTTEQAIIELAILGSCTCRGKNNEPCLCARSACRRQGQVDLLKRKVSDLDEQKEEMQRLMEIYREAFEEQLDRNRALTKKVAQLDRENEIITKSGKLHTLLRIRLHKDTQSNVISSLIDMVCDRTDALLQQQVLTKLLSRRLTELERINQQSNS